MKATVLVSAFLAKLQPWSRAERKIAVGSNRQVLPWTEKVRTHHRLNASQYDVLRVVATHMGREAWDDMRLCIAWIVERVSWSRSTVERALAFLRKIFVLRQDGEFRVKRGRPVVRYRLGSTPECPLPWHVVEARETAGQGGDDVYTSITGPSVLVEDQGETPDLPSFSPTAGVSIYRPAEPVKTGPHENARGGARRGPHLRWLRRVAESLVGGRPAPTPTGGCGTPQDDCVAVGEAVAVSPSPAVTYCHPPTRGEAVNPFTDPDLGDLPRDTRLFYLGLLDIHSRLGSRTPSDEMFLKAELFRYDEDITQRDITRMKQALIAKGKIAQEAGRVRLLEAPAAKEVALLATPKRTRAKAPLEDPWFATFWELYPRRTGKGAARKAYITAVTSGASPQAINDAAASYADRCGQLQKEPQFIPHPSTWLNQERWEDDEEQAPRVRSKVDDALHSGLDLVNFYQQQEAIPFDGPKELGW